MRSFPMLVVLALAAAALSAAPVPKELVRANDGRRIVGAWKQESLSVRGGEAQAGANGTTFRFRADGTCGITSGLGNRENSAEYTLDPKASPRRMKWLNGPEKTEWRCLYELEGDSLKVCFVDHQAELPAKLEPGPTSTIYYLKRSNE